MRRTALLIALALFPTISLHAPAFSTLSADTKGFVPVDQPVVALPQVLLIDGTCRPVAGDQTVVLSNGKIQAVGKTRSVQVPAGARTMDLSGHTVIPGVVGLHDHTYLTPRWVQLTVSGPRMYLGNGVTSIR